MCQHYDGEREYLMKQAKNRADVPIDVQREVALKMVTDIVGEPICSIFKDVIEENKRLREASCNIK